MVVQWLSEPLPNDKPPSNYKIYNCRYHSQSTFHMVNHPQITKYIIINADIIRRAPSKRYTTTLFTRALPQPGSATLSTSLNPLLNHPPSSTASSTLLNTRTSDFSCGPFVVHLCSKIPLGPPQIPLGPPKSRLGPSNPAWALQIPAWPPHLENARDHKNATT